MEMFYEQLSTGLPAGSPPPVKPEAGAVPADHGLGLHDDENVAPPPPEVAECRPKQ
jgi:hypothetical protein